MNDGARLNLPSRKLVWVLRVLSLVALSLSSYLAWSAYQQAEVYGCGGGEVWDCGHVLHSQWSKWLGMPVSVPAVGIYVSVLIALAICGSNAKNSTKHIAWAIVTVGSLSAGLAATWFISLQVFELKKLCVYCMCAHGCGLVLSALILWRRPLGKKMTSALSGLSVLGACALIAGQVLTAPPKTYAEERYDNIDFSVNDGEVFAIEGIESEHDSDEFLIAPIDEMLPPDDSTNEAEGSVLNLPFAPNTTGTPERDSVTAVSPDDSDVDDGLAEFVSKYSVKLAEDIRKQLSEDQQNNDNTSNAESNNDMADLDDLVLTNDVAPFREIDGLKFESIDEEKATVEHEAAEVQTVVQSGSTIQAGVQVNPFVSSAQTQSNDTTSTDELTKARAEIAQDLADLHRTSTPQTQPSSQKASDANLPNAKAAAEAKSIAVVGESMGIRNTQPDKPVVSPKQTRNRLPFKPHQFARDASILVHDVPLLTDKAKSTPTATATPLPAEDTVVTTAKAEPQKPKRNLVAVLGGRAKLDSRHWPLIGDTGAKYVLVELFDYTCPHCRKMNQHIQAARQRYGNDLSIMTLPVPLSQECNDTVTSTKVRHQAACELARLSVAVWRVNPQAYEAFHDWLFIPEHGRTTGEAWSYAGQLVGDDLLRAEMAKPTVNQFISKHVELYKRAGQGTVPKLMFPKVTIRGEMNSPDALYSVLERELFSAN